MIDGLLRILTTSLTLYYNSLRRSIMTFRMLSSVAQIDRCWKIYTNAAPRVEVTIREVERSEG